MFFATNDWYEFCSLIVWYECSNVDPNLQSSLCTYHWKETIIDKYNIYSYCVSVNAVSILSNGLFWLQETTHSPVHIYSYPLIC